MSENSVLGVVGFWGRTLTYVISIWHLNHLHPLHLSGSNGLCYHDLAHPPGLPTYCVRLGGAALQLAQILWRKWVGDFLQGRLGVSGPGAAPTKLLTGQQSNWNSATQHAVNILVRRAASVGKVVQARPKLPEIAPTLADFDRHRPKSPQVLVNISPTWSSSPEIGRMRAKVGPTPTVDISPRFAQFAPNSSTPPKPAVFELHFDRSTEQRHRSTFASRGHVQKLGRSNFQSALLWGAHMYIQSCVESPARLRHGSRAIHNYPLEQPWVCLEGSCA